MILTYDNFIANLHTNFPDFKESLDDELLGMLEDNPTVTCSYFVFHFHKKLGDERFEKDLIDILDKMIDVEGLVPVLDDFLLDIYSHMREKAIDLKPFLNKLTPRARTRYDLNVDTWERANGIKM